MHGKIYDNISEVVGNTPLIRVNRVLPENAAELAVKLESFNPLSSVKDRIAYSMITEAEKSGELKPGMTIVEATSGNTGIGLAFVAAARGYRCVLVMPDTMSVERRKLLQALGAELILTPGPAGLGFALQTAREYAETVAFVQRGLTREPALLLEPLRERMAALACAERFEEAADVRDRAEALSTALHRQRRAEQLRRSGTIELDLGNGMHVELEDGRLLRSWTDGELALGVTCEPPDAGDTPWVPPALADELLCVAAWLDKNTSRVRLVRCDGTLASPLPAVPQLLRV